MNLLSSIKSFMLKCTRVWRITKKPGIEEFKTIAKVSAVGVLLLGLIGFVMAIIMKFIF